MPESWLVLVGAVIVPFALFAIGLAWAAHQTRHAGFDGVS